MGKVVYHWDSLRHSAFDHSSLQFAAIAAPDSFYYCVSDTEGVPCAVKGYSAEKSYHFFDKPLGYLGELISQDALLCADFELIRIACRGLPFLVKRPDESVEMSIVADTGPGDQVLSDRINDDLRLDFVVPRQFVREAENWFSGARIGHAMCGLIALALQISREVSGVYALVNASDRLVEIVICDHERLVFANHYRITAPTDVLYFMLAVLTEIEYSPDVVELDCSGPLAQEILNALQSYFPMCGTVRVGLGLGVEYPEAEASDVLSVLRCAS